MAIAWNPPARGTAAASTSISPRLGSRSGSIVSLWYAWDRENGALRFATSANADLVEFVEADDHVSFDVSTNDPPYKGVRGRGRATVTPDADKRLLRTLLDRFLGGADNPTGDRLLRPDREEVEVRIEPKRVHTWDYAERMESDDE